MYGTNKMFCVKASYIRKLHIAELNIKSMLNMLTIDLKC